MGRVVNNQKLFLFVLFFTSEEIYGNLTLGIGKQCYPITAAAQIVFALKSLLASFTDYLLISIFIKSHYNDMIKQAFAPQISSSFFLSDTLIFWPKSFLQWKRYTQTQYFLLYHHLEV